ncbi:MAG TPA: YdeI/OmpD-associated family protein [Chloroflexota bacterium]|nr:YdeI/OmpD-associated family protein [Chloroflexota bacterium]
MRFKATIQLNGKTATGIEVPPEVMASFESKRPAVSVTLKGYTYRTTVGVMGGRFLIPVSTDVRAAAGVAAGDELEVGIEPDNAPREVAIPADLAQALEGDTTAKRFFDGLSYSLKRWYVLPIEGAKSPETRQRRVARALEMMHEGRTA